MKIDNDSYTITHPDLLLTENGTTVFISSTNQKFIEDVKTLWEKYVASSIVFAVQPKQTTGASIAWMWNISQNCDALIIDLDTCAWVDIIASMQKVVDENHYVVFYTEKHKRRDAEKVINATSKYMIMTSIQELDEFLKLELTGLFK
jgi:hypothetical protein